MSSVMMVRGISSGDRLVISTANVVRVAWHWRGEQVLCGGNWCPICKVERARETVYVAVRINGSQAWWLWECPSESWAGIVKLWEIGHGTGIEVFRRHKRARWTVTERWQQVEDGTSHLWPQQADIWAAVMRLHRVPRCPDGVHPSVHFGEVARRRLSGDLPGQQALPFSASEGAELPFYHV